MSEEEKPKYRNVVEGIDALSLGISIVVAILLGVGIGLWLKNLFDAPWLLWLGVFWGVGGAVFNIYKAYKRELLEFEKIAQNPRYQIQQTKDEEED